jgi:hypothetical protein
MFEAAEADLAAVKKVLGDTQLQGCVVRLRGLPYTATAEDVAAFFEVSTARQLPYSTLQSSWSHSVPRRPDLSVQPWRDSMPCVGPLLTSCAAEGRLKQHFSTSKLAAEADQASTSAQQLHPAHPATC